MSFYVHIFQTRPNTGTTLRNWLPPIKHAGDKFILVQDMKHNIRHLNMPSLSLIFFPTSVSSPEWLKHMQAKPSPMQLMLLHDPLKMLGNGPQLLAKSHASAGAYVSSPSWQATCHPTSSSHYTLSNDQFCRRCRCKSFLLSTPISEISLSLRSHSQNS